MSASFNFDDDIRKATKKRIDKLELERIAREEKLELERIARERRIKSSKEQCEKEFNAAKKKWFEERSTEIRASIIEQISRGKTEWTIEVGKTLNKLEICIKVGSGSELQEKKISVADIYDELIAKLREYYDASTVCTESKLVTDRCKGFVSTGGPIGMSCKCGKGRSQHKSRQPQIASIAIRQK